TYLSPNAPLQLALSSLLATRQEFCAQVLWRLTTNLNVLDLRVGPAGDWTRRLCEGGWNAIVQATARAKESDACIRLLRDGTLAYSGGFYGLDCRSVVLSLLVSSEQIELAKHGF